MGESVLKRVRATSHHATISFEGRPLTSADVETYAEDPQGCFYVASIVDAEIAKLRDELSGTIKVREAAFERIAALVEEIERLKAEAAKDAECIAALGASLNSFDAEDQQKFSATFGLRKVNGKWERAK